MPEPLAYLNGRLVPFGEAGLALHDAGFVSGATIVDNARTFRHRLFRWPDHLARFRRNCESCYVPLVVADGEITSAAEELIARNAKLLPPGGELQLVTFATPGPLGFYLGGTDNGPPTLGMATYPLPFERYRRFFTEGVSLAVAGFQASDSADALPPSVKHRSRLIWHLAEKRLRDPDTVFYRDDPGAVPVLLNLDGIGDTAIAGILAVSDGAVIAPEHGTVIDSVSVKVVGELCAVLGIQFLRAPFDMRGLSGSSTQNPPSEILLAGTGFCLAGVRRIGSGKESRDYTWPGPVLRRLLGGWSDLVGLDIAGQFTRP
jgi:hypothetical protein